MSVAPAIVGAARLRRARGAVAACFFLNAVFWVGLVPRLPELKTQLGLSTTEERVAELAADGLANKEIAQAMFVSVRTVEVHLKNVYRKLGIRSRTQLARRLSDAAARE